MKVFEETFGISSLQNKVFALHERIVVSKADLTKWQEHQAKREQQQIVEPVLKD